jgi:transposase
LRNRFGYSLKVFSRIASQRNEADRELYKYVLRGLVNHPNQVVFVDETAKDRNASRRGRAWGRRGQKTHHFRPFGDVVRYTCIAACDIHGFIPQACDIVLRETTESSTGTVDTECFVAWVKNKLAPVLGDYVKGEPQSIVIMDNAIMHLDSHVQDAIEAKGALLVYLSPYSPDFNPIEMMFSVYKANLKRHSIHATRDSWFGLHVKALLAVTPAIARNQFHHCGIPGIEQIPLVEDMNKETEALLQAAMLLLLED